MGLFAPAVHALEERRLPTGYQPLRRTVEGMKIENELKGGMGKMSGMAAKMGVTVTAGEVLATVE
jgi:hypothetical protein